jgi:hypothetical protein
MKKAIESPVDVIQESTEVVTTETSTKPVLPDVPENGQPEEAEVVDVFESEDETSPEPEMVTVQMPPIEPMTEMTELEKLIHRRTGYWKVKMELLDLKWVKNACQGKLNFTGPNEAFMLMNCYLGFSGAVARMEQEKDQTVPVDLQASAIEACALLLNKYSSSGIESAQRVFRIAIALNDVIMEMKNLDAIIQQLRDAEEKQKEALRHDQSVLHAAKPLLSSEPEAMPTTELEK